MKNFQNKLLFFGFIFLNIMEIICLIADILRGMSLTADIIFSSLLFLIFNTLIIMYYHKKIKSQQIERTTGNDNEDEDEDEDEGWNTEDK